MYYPGWLKKLYYGALHLNNNIGEFYLQRLRGSAANLCFQKTLYSSACVYTGRKIYRILLMFVMVRILNPHQRVFEIQL